MQCIVLSLGSIDDTDRPFSDSADLNLCRTWKIFLFIFTMHILVLAKVTTEM